MNDINYFCKKHIKLIKRWIIFQSWLIKQMIFFIISGSWKSTPLHAFDESVFLLWIIYCNGSLHCYVLLTSLYRTAVCQGHGFYLDLGLPTWVEKIFLKGTTIINQWQEKRFFTDFVSFSEARNFTYYFWNTKYKITIATSFQRVLQLHIN